VGDAASGGAGLSAGGVSGGGAGGSGSGTGGAYGGESGDGGSGVDGGESGDGGSGNGGNGGSSGSGGTSGGSAGEGGTGGTSGVSGRGGSGDGAAGNRCTGPGGDDMERRHGQRARSSGFPGTVTQYNELYDLPACATNDDCVPPCIERGGSEGMCAGMECVQSSYYCVPPAIWTNLGKLATEGTDIYADGAQLVLWSNPYRDSLLVDDFKLEVPAGATILGITATVRRAAGGPDVAVDAGVHVIKGGVIGSADRSSRTQWTGPQFVSVDYGGEDDLWGETWTPADVNAPDFGVALSAGFTRSAGNGRAYVDIVYVTVHYTWVCE
jgi:hypothetical protein